MVNVDRIKVEKQAKEILDKFASALEKVGKDQEEETYVDREYFERNERSIGSEAKASEDSKNAVEAGEGFKERILANAPNHDDDFIIAEKGNWK